MDEPLAPDHARLYELLGALNVALDAGNLQLSHERLDLFWAGVAVHIRAEHLHLFPTILRALREKGGSSPSLAEAQQAIEELRHDHDFFMRELAHAIAILRNLKAATEESAIVLELKQVFERISVVAARLVSHNRLEEDQVYRWVSGLLSEAEQTRLAADLRHELAHMPPRFSAAQR